MLLPGIKLRIDESLSVESDDSIYEDRMVSVLISLIICVNLDVKIDWIVFINDAYGKEA